MPRAVSFLFARQPDVGNRRAQGTQHGEGWDPHSCLQIWSRYPGFLSFLGQGHVLV